jgi:hypothetical protein
MCWHIAVECGLPQRYTLLRQCNNTACRALIALLIYLCEALVIAVIAGHELLLFLMLPWLPLLLLVPF